MMKNPIPPQSNNVIIVIYKSGLAYMLTISVFFRCYQLNIFLECCVTIGTCTYNLCAAYMSLDSDQQINQMFDLT